MATTSATQQPVKITSGGIFRVASIVKRLWKSHANSGICFPTCSHLYQDKNFHWHMSEVIFTITIFFWTNRASNLRYDGCDRGAGRKLWGATLHSIGDICVITAGRQRLRAMAPNICSPSFARTIGS